jgi:hypothetical protein
MTTSTPGGIESGVMPSFDGRPCVVENCRRAEANLPGEAIVVVEAGSIEGNEEGEAAAAEKALLRALPRPGARIEAIGVVLVEVEPGDGQLVRFVAIEA